MTSKAKLIRQDDYVSRPWKNGKGETRDVVLIPDGSDHHTFDVRVAFSPIETASVFSRYEGVERVLTLIEGEDLVLDFDFDREPIHRFQSIRFDCELPVTGTPGCSNVVVINVMVRKCVWEISHCTVATDLDKTLDPDDLALLIPLSNDWVIWSGTKRLSPKQHETVLVEGPGEVFAGSHNGKCLIAVLRKKA